MVKRAGSGPAAQVQSLMRDIGGGGRISGISALRIPVGIIALAGRWARSNQAKFIQVIVIA